MKWLALLFILLIVPSAFATAVTVDIFGTNVSNAQTNITQTGNNSYQVIQWAIGDTTKSLKADINGNASDSITFTLHNFTVGRVIEVKVNSSSFNAYQADSTGTINFTRTQTVRNQTYSFTPAVNAAGYNFTWAQFWTYPFIQGTNLSTIITTMITAYNYLPLSGTTSDLDMNGKNITNVQTLNVTTTNVTVLNATNIQGNGSGIFSLNASNITIGVLPNTSIPLSAANTSKNNTFTATGNQFTTEAWTACSFVNSWGDAGGGLNSCGFRRNALNIVEIRGVISGGTSNTVAFTLPAGYFQPGINEYPAAADASGAPIAAELYIEANGDVRPRFAGGSLSGFGLGIMIPTS